MDSKIYFGDSGYSYTRLRLNCASCPVFQVGQGEWNAEAVKSDAVWFCPDKRHAGNDLQDLLVDVLTKFLAPRGFDLRRDVQVKLSEYCL